MSGFYPPQLSKPITPEEVPARKVSTFPTFVFDAFNQLIVKKFVNKNTKIVIKQHEIIQLIVALGRRDKNISLTDQDIFDNGYLDVEEVYRDAGWYVCYVKPAYCENFDPYFEFKVK